MAFRGGIFWRDLQGGVWWLLPKPGTGGISRERRQGGGWSGHLIFHISVMENDFLKLLLNQSMKEKNYFGENLLTTIPEMCQKMDQMNMK